MIEQMISCVVFGLSSILLNPFRQCYEAICPGSINTIPDVMVLREAAAQAAKIAKLHYAIRSVSKHFPLSEQNKARGS